MVKRSPSSGISRTSARSTWRASNPRSETSTSAASSRPRFAKKSAIRPVSSFHVALTSTRSVSPKRAFSYLSESTDKRRIWPLASSAMRANGWKIAWRHAGPFSSLKIGAMTLTNCAWLAILTRSPCRSSEFSRVPTTTASVTLYLSSMTRGCSRHPAFATLWGWSWVSRPRWYQTFHSSKERLMCFLCFPFARTASAVAMTDSMK